MNRFLIVAVFLSILSSASSYGQGNKPVKSISLDQLLGRKTAKVERNSGSREHVGAVGAVLERIDLQGTAMTQDMIEKLKVKLGK